MVDAGRGTGNRQKGKGGWARSVGKILRVQVCLHRELNYNGKKVCVATQAEVSK